MAHLDLDGLGGFLARAPGVAQQGIPYLEIKVDAAALVDRLLQPRNFGSDLLGAGDRPVPGLPGCVPLVHPALQYILGLERRVEGIDRPVLLRQVREQRLEHQGARLRQALLEYLQQGEAIGFCPMGAEEEAELEGDVVELACAQAFPDPVDLGEGAAPGQGLEDREPCFEEGTIKLGVVGNDERSAIDQCGDPGIVNPLAGHHLVGDAGDLGDFRGDRHSRVFQAAVGVQHPIRLSRGRVIFKDDNPDLDDPVGVLVEARRFGIDNDAAGERPAIGFSKRRARRQLTQYPVVGVGFKLLREGFGVLVGEFSHFWYLSTWWFETMADRRYAAVPSS